IRSLTDGYVLEQKCLAIIGDGRMSAIRYHINIYNPQFCAEEARLESLFMQAKCTGSNVLQHNGNFNVLCQHELAINCYGVILPHQWREDNCLWILKSIEEFFAGLLEPCW